jgi:RNA 3'-terminal phosphate cyclase (ATP)
MIDIDGAMGEGGGQVLRSCLSLSLITGQAFKISNIRMGRKKPGLRAQHLASVKIAATVSQASVEGAEQNSTSLSFSPKSITPGNYRCDIGTAGSTALVLQTVCLALSLCSIPSALNISGGTHAPFAPIYEFLNQQRAYYMNILGFRVSLNSEQAGFFPRGGGHISATIKPLKSISALNLLHRGSLKQIRGLSAVANLDRRIAERQREQVIRRLGQRYPLNDIRIVQLPSRFKGTTLCLICEFEHSQCCYFSLGAPGKPAEKVANEVCEHIEFLLSSEATLDQFISDQLLLPLAFAKSQSTYSTAKVTRHLLTNAKVIQSFLPTRIKISGEIDSPGSIIITPHTI